MLDILDLLLFCAQNFLLVCESRRNNRGFQRQASVLNPPEQSTDTNNCHCWNRLCAVNCVIFQTLAFLAITSHLRTMFSDPFYIAVISSHAFFLAISHFIMCVNND
ncbi:hypothetical protein CDAR_242901 [Caerostris darwini]|uniref:Uncharacterized protein n=1 Tax=Caerostris darwini TaxID=1538125 RepID=A0AAV4UH73_9ARAC|nr:hypothetical protein CDAR_242901 [Caerostris darwini]